MKLYLILIDLNLKYPCVVLKFVTISAGLEDKSESV